MACEMGTKLEDGMRPPPIEGVGTDDRLERTASFLRRDVRRPRMLETTIYNISTWTRLVNQQISLTFDDNLAILPMHIVRRSLVTSVGGLNARNTRGRL